MTVPPTAEGALIALVQSLRDAAVALHEAAERAERLLGRQRAVASWGEVMRAEPKPLVVEEVMSTLEALTLATGRWRRANAQALHGEDWTMEQIAELYGVSRQRVSALLRSDPPHDRTSGRYLPPARPGRHAQPRRVRPRRGLPHHLELTRAGVPARGRFRRRVSAISETSDPSS